MKTVTYAPTRRSSTARYVPGLTRARHGWRLSARSCSSASRAATALTVAAVALSTCPLVAAPSAAAQARAPEVTSRTTLRLGFEGDMGAPDPDVFYATEGLEVTTSVYQGLLQYANNSTHIVGDLARSWSVSPNGLTYTFHLHSGVRFHDGTPFNSAAVKFSFARRTEIDQAPAYMLAHVGSVATPNPLTVMVHLDQPVSAFLDYLASPFGPKMVSPTEIRAHNVKNDEAQNWLINHDAGTGPYRITSWDANQHYVLSRFPHYWGPAPYFSRVIISIIPSITTQQIELRNGDLDIIFHGLSPAAVNSFKGNKAFEVHEYPTEMKGILFINEHKGPFTTEAARDALEEVLDKAVITRDVYGTAGTPSTQIFPAGELSQSVESSVVPYDPSVLKALVPKLPTRVVDIGYDPTDPRNQVLAELAQVALEEAGMSATTRAIPIAQIFGLATAPAKAPDILIQTTNPDAAHPDTWARIYMSKAGGANYLQCWSTAADDLMNEGLAATTVANVDKDYGEAGNMLVKQGCFIDIADVQDVIVSRAGLTGFYHVPSIPWALNLETLQEVAN
jgi:peptide/nickel transport system substrate-binding protein